MNLIPIILTLLAMLALAAALALVPRLRCAAKQSLQRGAFVAVIVVLGASALGLNATVSFLKLHFKKQPLPLAVRSLTDSTEGMPVQLGHWISVSPDEAINPEIQQTLMTAQYLFRDYADTRRWPKEQLLALRDKSKDEREAAIASMQAQSPQSILRVAVTYYTGLADTVAHIPERCYVADGFDVSSYETHYAVCGSHADGSPRAISFRLINFEDQTARGRVGRDVGYLFHVDGAYESDSLIVRNRLASLRERYGYYAKVELMTTAPPGHDEQHALSQAAMIDFLTVALPELERMLPDWKRVHEQGSKEPVSGMRAN
jgi:hypothetical protein